MVRLSLQLHPQHTSYRDLRMAACRAEELGVDVLYTWDHFFPLTGDANGNHFECFALLAALAEATQNIPIGPMVACNSYRNPELLADIARTIDHISGGRFILGIGSGWFERDYTEYGYEFGTALERLVALEAALPRIKTRLAKLNPPAVGPMPILIGGGGEKVTLRLTAEYADIWHGFARETAEFDAIGSVMHKMSVLDGWCKKAGRDPNSVERAIGVERTRIDLADAIVAAGAHEIMIDIAAPEFDFGVVKEWLAWRDQHNSQQ